MDYVGIPYKSAGTDPETGLDCYGLVRYVLNTECGLHLPEQPPSAFVWHRYVKPFRPPLPAFEKYDVLMFDDIIPGIANHIGIMVSRTDFIQAGSAFGGVVCTPVYVYRHRIMALGRPHDH